MNSWTHNKSKNGFISQKFLKLGTGETGFHGKQYILFKNGPTLEVLYDLCTVCISSLLVSKLVIIIIATYSGGKPSIYIWYPCVVSTTWKCDLN